jgi:hypothetical protein
MNKMKNMPGMGNLQSMLSKMGMGCLGGGGKVNTAAMETQLNQRLKMAKTKERIRAKAEANAIAKAAAQLKIQQSEPEQQPKMSDEELVKLLEKPERTPRCANQSQQQSSNKKKKGKK